LFVEFGSEVKFMSAVRQDQGLGS